ncbi:hypothetical protein FA15DRAFT_660462 [Coprinopsis marcescibilis]|uniref:Helitron helicase-like domain-containing protein n=1 Tax=Coprinopsis marcescibilis TaxID=230819 RepID=A0A5C3KGE9_COPMA|nr:hypothetical protein FA15DRAFT_660462 [Coprinopsis marcescibilis]
MYHDTKEAVRWIYDEINIPNGTRGGGGQCFAPTSPTLIITLFGIRVGSRGGIQRRRGIFGVVQDYLGAVEAQGRGTLHLHLLVWLRDALTAQEMKAALQSAQFRSRIVHYINTCFHADIQEKGHQDVKRMRCMKEVGFARPVDPHQDGDWEARWERSEPKLARALQFHKKGLLEGGVLSAPEVMSYLMGWGDCITSHTYATLYWHGAEAALLWTYPWLKPIPSSRRCQTRVSHGDETSSTSGEAATSQKSPMVETPDEAEEDNNQEMDGESEAREKVDDDDLHAGFVGGDEAEDVRREHVDENSLKPQDQFEDYRHRGQELHEYSLLDFVLKTYEKRDGKGQDDEENQGAGNGRRGPGRPAHLHVPYIGRYKRNNYRMVCGMDAEVLPRIAGHWFPQHDDPPNYPFYCAAILILLRPWRNLEHLLEGLETTSFMEGFQQFCGQTSKHNLRILDNIQSYHDCAWDVNVEDPFEATSTVVWEGTTGGDPTVVMDSQGHPAEGGVWCHPVINDTTITDEMIEEAWRNTVLAAGQVSAFEASSIAERLGVFGGKEGDDSPMWKLDGVHQADQQQEKQIRSWATKLRTAVREDELFDGGEQEASSVSTNVYGRDVPPAVLGHDDYVGCGCSKEGRRKGKSQLKQRPCLSILNADQRRAHDIIARHLLQCLTEKGVSLQPLHMLVMGEGGTGKSNVIEALTETFAHFGVSNAWITTPLDQQSKKAIARKDHILAAEYVIIDELSMIDKTQLHALDAIMRAIRNKEGVDNVDLPFGGSSYAWSTRLSTKWFREQKWYANDRVWQGLLQRLRSVEDVDDVTNEPATKSMKLALAAGGCGDSEEGYPLMVPVGYDILQHAFIFVRLSPGLIPLMPLHRTITDVTLTGELLKVHRWQYAIVPGHAFTDYKAQGQTLEAVIVDLAEPPGQKLDPFHAYVALSRQRGWDCI